MDRKTRELLLEWAEIYNDRKYFETDPISFPRKFFESGAPLQDIEVAAVFSAHFAWGRREMIVRDCARLFDHMCWKPYDYVMAGDWRDDGTSIHRTVKWREIAAIWSRLQGVHERQSALEGLSDEQFRIGIFGQKSDLKAPNKKINMLRRWMVRDDGKVDLGVWKNTDKASLLIPLDVHVYDEAVALGITSRKQKDMTTVKEITGVFDELFPGDPCKGDFALFGYGVTHK